jgi:hypothetical protein
LAAEGYHTVSFAAPLKNMLVALLESMGYDNAQAWHIVKNKEMIVPTLGFRSRTLQQKLGTEWGRMAMSESFWVRVWEARARRHIKVVADDCRFPNEVEAVKNMGGQVWKIVRPSVVNKETHVSEGQLDNWDGFDQVIINDGSLNDLTDKVLNILGYDAQR